jgi:hypothetical protein
MGARFYWVAAGLVLVALAGCSRPVQGENGRSANVSRPTGLDELTITPGPQQTATSRVGQVVVIVTPDASRRWQLDYATDILEALTPADQMERPGKAWRFRSSRAGETDVRITAIGEAGSPAPAPIQFVITIRVTP